MNNNFPNVFTMTWSKRKRAGLESVVFMAVNIERVVTDKSTSCGSTIMVILWNLSSLSSLGFCPLFLVDLVFVLNKEIYYFLVYLEYSLDQKSFS